MIRATFRLTHKVLMHLLHLCMLAALLGIAVVTFVLWQFSKGPIDLTFAADYIKTAFEVEGQPVTLDFDSVVATWPDMKGSPDINLTNLRVLDNGEEAFRLQQASLQIAFLPLLIGRLSPESIVLNGPVIRMVRGEDGSFRLLLNDTEASATELPGLAELGNGLFRGGTLPGNLSIFSKLKTLNIRNAHVIAETAGRDVLWDIPSVSLYLMRTHNVIEMNASYMMPGREEGLSVLNARIQRHRLRHRIDYTADLRNVDMAVIAHYITAMPALKGQSVVLNGLVSGSLSEEWQLQTALAAVSSSQGHIRLASSEKALTYQDLMLNLDYDRASGRLDLKDTTMKLNDTTVSIVASRASDENGRRILPVTLKVPELTLDQVSSLWPETQRDNNAAAWLTRDLSGATLRNINVTANIPEEDPATFTGHDVDVTFDFENLKADYRAPLIPATQARGSGTIKDDILDIRIDSGKLADIDVSAARVVITELASDVPGLATIDVTAAGPLSTVFDYISRDPINLGGTIGIDPKKVQGRGDYSVNITFPTAHDIPKDAVKVKVDATLNDARLPGIVQGLDLTGGPYKLKVADGAFTLSGAGQLDGTPIELTYSEYINPSSAPFAGDIKAKLVTTKKLRDSFGVNLDDFVEGDLPAEIHYKEPKPGDITVAVDIDMTPATAFVKPFNYVKPAGAPGRASCVAVLKDDRIQQIRDLSVTIGQEKTRQDKATGGVIHFGQVGKEWDVKSGSFDKIALGPDNDFKLNFTQSPQRLSFDIEGSSLDARAFLEPEQAPATGDAAQPSATSVSVTAKAGRARTGDDDDQVVSSPVIKADVDPSGDIRLLEVTAMAGKSPLSLTLKPDAASGRMKLKIRAADAGATLRAFDLYDNIVGGQLYVDGAQIGGGRINDIKGIASIRDFRIVDAPVLAQLMNSFSFEGMDELVKRKGISFTRLRTDFVWKDTAEGRVINVTDGRTSGASIGLSFGGQINQTKGTIDISGTFVPLSGVNSFVSSIPLVGKLLTGGKHGGIIAATYAVKGESDNPRVVINPLSVLAPGFLRSILFEREKEFDDEPPPEKPAPDKKAGYN